jgi:hypothetical protein
LLPSLNVRLGKFGTGPLVMLAIFFASRNLPRTIGEIEEGVAGI